MLASTMVPARRSDEEDDLPPAPAPGEVTRHLDALAAGATGAGEALLELLYGELHRVAATCMRRERADHTLQPTALVHEVWMRILADGARDYESRAHFLRTAAQAMRRVLVDHARRRVALKAEAPGRREPLEEWLVLVDARQLDLVALDEALAELERADPALARLVELRFFGGLSIAETADILGRSTASLERDWRVARALLQRCLDGAGG